MALDTRGAMDGLLRGYSTVKNIQNDEERMQMQRDGIKENNRRYRESRNDTLARYAIDDERYQAEQKKEAERYQNEQERIKNNDAMSRKVKNAQLASYDANLKQSNAKFNREQKLAYLQDNMPVIQDGVRRFMQTGEVDSIFDNDYVKGGAYDPRRYTPSLVRAAYDIERTMPKVLAGEVDYRDPKFTASVAKFYENNVKQGIGEKDEATGKVIKDKEYLRHDFVADIDPNREGEQPGVVIGLKITYDDNSTKNVPVTEGRGTSPEEAVKVVPLDQFISDIGEQTKLAKQFFTSAHYNNLFGAKDGQNKEFEKEYRQAIIDIDKDETKAISELMDKSPESQAEVRAIFDERRKAVKAIYGKVIADPDPGSQSDADIWAGKDADKVQFIAELTQDRGIDVDKLDATQLEGMYQQMVAANNKKKREEEYQQKLAKLRSERLDSAKQTAAVPDLEPEQPGKPAANLQDVIYSDNLASIEQLGKEQYEKDRTNLSRLRDYPQVW
ncbi:ATPase [Vibrio sp. 2175-1]|uniref:ATPase n=1 Tax=Vibrio TaxID=662 RepID=UPI001CDD0429|nr:MULTISPECIES: ATPase [Vibrio]MCA2497767.1 ATPase [Vibrio alginolyticus]MDW2217454.1 ATPase [Vibrio sp. 2175-1]